uniref:Interleukin-7 n=1 Tax=Trachinotus ovatus TaxID=173339 RepID=A0A1W5KJT4_TRAOV|nr:interleukin-7 [Trachinotus ovatus]
MPLLCISLLALLLLPLSLSCVSKRPPAEVRKDYMEIVEIELDNTRGSIMALLHNSSCPELKQKLRRCTDTTNVVTTLHFLTCKMKNLRFSHTDGLAMSVINSIRCPCLGKPTNEPSTRSKTATRQRRNDQRKSKEIKNLCKAKAILSTMTECYEMLNTLLMDT